MKKFILTLLVVLSSAFVLAGCQNPRDTQALGTVAGGVGGGYIGSAVTGGSTLGTIGGTLGGAYIGREVAKNVKNP